MLWRPSYFPGRWTASILDDDMLEIGPDGVSSRICYARDFSGSQQWRWIPLAKSLGRRTVDHNVRVVQGTQRRCDLPIGAAPSAIASSNAAGTSAVRKPISTPAGCLLTGRECPLGINISPKEC